MSHLYSLIVYYSLQFPALIEGFAPVVICAPVLGAEDGPERLFGKPLVAPAWDQQKEYEEIRELNIASARRHSIRQYIAHPNLAKNRDFKEAVESGQDGAIVFERYYNGMEWRTQHLSQSMAKSRQ